MVKLFAWTEIEPLGDLKRLQLALDFISDENLGRTVALCNAGQGTRQG